MEFILGIDTAPADKALAIGVALLEQLPQLVVLVQPTAQLVVEMHLWARAWARAWAWAWALA